FGAARVENGAATHGLHACTEAMTALANQLARLIGTFHGTTPATVISSREEGVYALTPAASMLFCGWPVGLAVHRCAPTPPYVTGGEEFRPVRAQARPRAAGSPA